MNMIPIVALNQSIKNIDWETFPIWAQYLILGSLIVTALISLIMLIDLIRNY